LAWILTDSAVTDLDRMAADGAIRFGFAQSEVYEQEMVAAFDRLAAMPYLQ
jgi:Plasmid stabilization system protein